MRTISKEAFLKRITDDRHAPDAEYVARLLAKVANKNEPIYKQMTGHDLLEVARRYRDTEYICQVSIFKNYGKICKQLSDNAQLDNYCRHCF